MKKKLICILAVLLLVTSCGKVPKLKNGDEAVVTMKDGDISVEELYSEMKEKYEGSSLPRIEIETVFEKYAPDFVNYIKGLDLENEREV